MPLAQPFGAIHPEVPALRETQPADIPIAADEAPEAPTKYESAPQVPTPAEIWPRFAARILGPRTPESATAP